MTVRRTNGNVRVSVSNADRQTLDRPAQAALRVPPLMKRLYSAKEAGIYLGGKSAWSVRELMWRGELPYVTIGKRRIAFDVHDLDRFVEQRKVCEAP